MWKKLLPSKGDEHRSAAPVGRRAGCAGPPARRRGRRPALALLSALCGGCGVLSELPGPNEVIDPVDSERYELLARFAHITDAHSVDEESPARLTVGASLTHSAWRPQEAYATQLLDGYVRTINKLHVATHNIDFVIHTGDAVDNAQQNELDWFITVMDGGVVDPLTGNDDRELGARPDRWLDPHHPFEAQGLYRHGVHGDAPTIEWYNVLGNHDRFAVGVFPITTDFFGNRTAPLPLEDRLPLFHPLVLDPLGNLAWAAITPAHPGPPPEINLPVSVPVNPARRYITDGGFVQAHLESETEPPGHGFDAAHPERTWYSVSPVPGLRLIGLNSATPLVEQPTLVYSEGAISFPQVLFLERELEKADAAGECAVVATHHPSAALELVYGSALTPISFRRLLNDHPSVKLHLAGHWHRNVVISRGGYVEIVTGSTLDAPQQGRIIEIWCDRSDPRAPARANIRHRSDPHKLVSPLPKGGFRGIYARTAPDADSDDASRCTLRYWMFSHLDQIDPPDGSQDELFNDPLLPLRRIAAELAGVPAGPSSTVTQASTAQARTHGALRAR